MTPIISLILPAGPEDRNLNKVIESLRNQTLPDYEVILVDSGSSNHALDDSLQEMVAAGKLRRLDGAGTGRCAAWKRGLEDAKGKYAVFACDADWYEPGFLEKMAEKAEQTQADIVSCHYVEHDDSGKCVRKTGVHTDWISGGSDVFSYRQCPLNILRITSQSVHNKLYSTEFLRKCVLSGMNLSGAGEISVVALSQSLAERITYVPEYLVNRYAESVFVRCTFKDVLEVVTGTVERMQTFSHWEQICHAGEKFAVEQCINALKEMVSDFALPESGIFYEQIHGLFNGPLGALQAEDIKNADLYRQYLTVKRNGYPAMLQMIRKKLIVSLTTYPARIHLIPQVLQSLEKQIRKADGIILWLADSQFPGKEADLPEAVQKCLEEKRLSVRWCEDLKAHKKYFYALQEFADDLVVTVDDDLRYSPDMLATLHASYLLNPGAVSSVRAHLMMFGEDGRLLPYGQWVQETDGCMHMPCMQLLATGGAGVLHPPGLYRREFFDEKAIRENCLWADDLWLKAMQAVSDVPVVLARKFELLNYLPDSQENGLVVYNVYQNQNDVQMDNLIRWTDAVFGPGTLMRKLTQHAGQIRLVGVEKIAAHLDRERKNNRQMYLQTSAKLKNTERSLKQSDSRLTETRDSLRETQTKWMAATDSLRQTEAELKRSNEALRKAREDIAALNARQIQQQRQISQLENQLADLRRQSEQTRQRLENQRSQLQSQLKDTQMQLRREKENAPIGRQLKAVGQSLAQQKAAGGNKLALGVKYLIYGLAWIPEKLLVGTMFFLKNGGKQTIRQITNRLFRK